ncbi:MAG TPA: flavodoxin family protein [Steroidobacteraceae bacterium]
MRELLEVAWYAYLDGRKSPVTRRAGKGFADPEYEISVDWLGTREAIRVAQAEHDDPAGKSRILLICGSPRNDQSCPGEMSKTYRMLQLAAGELATRDVEVDVLDLSLLISEYGKVIYPCKGCVSTAMPLCHWPCSCYPNHGLGQVNDWMSEIYPRWVRAHGILLMTPVHWYQAPAALKLMIDRLVCADGGNPDPSSTHGKKAEEAKALELRGWSYPRHLEGRSFAVVVHGDTAGTEALRRSLVDWLSDMGLVLAGTAAAFDRLVGYYEPYATSHETFDREEALHQEIRNAAQALMTQVERRRAGIREAREDLVSPRPK